MIYTIYKNGEKINTIVASKAYCEAYCKKHGYSCEAVEIPETEPMPEPTQLDVIEAQVTYTAMMTGTLLGG